MSRRYFIENPQDPTCSWCQHGKEFIYTSAEMICKSCGTSFEAPQFVNAFDDRQEPLDHHHHKKIPRNNLDSITSRLNIGETACKDIYDLLIEASGTLHIKDRIIGAAIYYVTDIPFHKIADVIGDKTQLTKGCAHLRETILNVPKWAPLVKQIQKQKDIYQNINGIISKLRIPKSDIILLRKNINKIDDKLTSTPAHQSLVRDVGVLWMAINMLPNPPKLKIFAVAAGVSIQSIFNSINTIKKVMGFKH